MKKDQENSTEKTNEDRGDDGCCLEMYLCFQTYGYAQEQQHEIIGIPAGFRL